MVGEGTGAELAEGRMASLEEELAGVLWFQLVPSSRRRKLETARSYNSRTTHAALRHSSPREGQGIKGESLT